MSKNLYSLLMLQPFIFQIICLQLCKGLNYFLKTYNKKLNQYCLSFIVFLAKKKKKSFKYGSGHGLGQVDLQKNRSSHGSTHICFGSTNLNLDQVFSGQVSKFWPILLCLICNVYSKKVSTLKLKDYSYRKTFTRIWQNLCLTLAKNC